MIAAAFLDRDGVINHDHGYIGDAEDFALIDGVPDALRILRDLGFALVVVTNQSGIGRGYYTEADYRRVTDRMRALLAVEGVALAAILHCPHAPDDGCSCRKPQPGMIVQAAAALDIDLARSVLFGDKASDLEAGRRAGVRSCFLVGTDPQAAPGADGVGANLLSCVRLLLPRDVASGVAV